MNNFLAYIHSIETFGTVDGPGIRFVIFMQGCPLKCKYCHNRDTWETNQGNLTNLTDLILEIKRYIPYMKSSGGGVTVSGGEPLLQTKFLINLFVELKKMNIHTALDTAGSIQINSDIEELLKYPVWIRQVIIPGYTDDKNDLLKLKNFISSLSNVEKVELLPYHDLGKFKWEQLGFQYPLNGVRSAENYDIDNAKKILGI